MNHNKLDNRKNNLRIVNYSENNYNTKKSKSNTSGIIGVYYEKASKKWKAFISKDHVLYLLGKYEDKTDAIVARLKAEKLYYENFSPQKNLFELYNI
jgi:hypothetical protein